MYMFEFKYELDRDDLSYIWQNLAPKKFEFGTDQASKYIAQLSRLETKRVKQIHKEFSEERKSASAQKVYHLLQNKVISDEYKKSDEFLKAVKDLVKLYGHFSIKGN